jgi:hypothetical protein
LTFLFIFSLILCTVDEEELRQVRVSKKELSDLVTELFDMVGNIDETLLDDDVNKVLKVSCDNDNVIFFSPQVPMPQQEILYEPNEIINTPERDVNTPEVQPLINAAPVANTSKTMISFSFNPNIVSTPNSGTTHRKTTQNVTHLIPYQLSAATPPPIFVQNPNNENELIPIKNFDFNSNTYKHTEGIIKLGTPYTISGNVDAEVSTTDSSSCLDLEPMPNNLTDDVKRVRYVENTTFKRNIRGLFDYVNEEKKVRDEIYLKTILKNG